MICARGMAAGCIYIGCQLTGESRTQGEIAKEAQGNRSHYKKQIQRSITKTRIQSLAVINERARAYLIIQASIYCI
jgi:hypothetical protein